MSKRERDDDDDPDNNEDADPEECEVIDELHELICLDKTKNSGILLKYHNAVEKLHEKWKTYTVEIYDEIDQLQTEIEKTKKKIGILLDKKNDQAFKDEVLNIDSDGDDAESESSYNSKDDSSDGSDSDKSDKPIESD